MRRIPFILIPAAKDYLWGGSRLNDDFGKGIDLSPLAETWECSTHPDGPSQLVSGESLRDILYEHPGWIGTHPFEITGGKPELPILIKLIDAKEALSVQVHPDDEYARRVENSLGKTEMWYVLNARPDSKLVYGFKQDMDPARVRAALNDGTIERYLNFVPIYKDDLFFIEAGTVHAIGAGALVAEIQESSNITYRLYDYDRKDKHGRKRQLHVDKALEVANLKSGASLRQPMRVMKYKNGCASEILARCKYFQVERIVLNTETQRNLLKYQTACNSFHALLCIDGCGSMSGEGFLLNFFKGDCVFVPADSIPFMMHGKAKLLDVSC